MPVYGRIDLVTQCLKSVAATTGTEVSVVVVDDRGPQPVPDELPARLLPGRSVTLLRNTRNLGFVGAVNRGLAEAGQRDVVVLNSDVTVLPGWLDALVAAAGGPQVASSSALADRGGVLSLGGLQGLRAAPPAQWSELTARARARLGETVPWVQIPVAVGHCMLLRGAAIAQVGVLDPVFAPGYGEEVDWSLRAARAGWRHMAALDSWVLHGEGASFATRSGRRRLRYAHEARLALRYPREFVSLRRELRGRSSLGASLARIDAAFGAERPAPG